jgi:hypothetical protein
VTFEFFRLRFLFKAVDPLWFPVANTANTVRGAFGYALRQVACRCAPGGHVTDCTYARIFEPRALARQGPSGFAEWPRPFVFRTRHLDGQLFSPRKRFHLDLHLFDLQNPAFPHFAQALALVAQTGLGQGRQQAKLIAVEQLDAEDRVLGRVCDGKKCSTLFVPASVAMADNGAVSSLCVRFLTPTELKCEGGLATQPDFPVLFARIRDRISTLRTLYGPGPLDIDFRGIGERTATIVMSRCQIETVRNERRSSRTGQVHPLGGFTGEAEYRGSLGEFLPYLHVARWTGVGRQTVWGKGEIAVAA